MAAAVHVNTVVRITVHYIGTHTQRLYKSLKDFAGRDGYNFQLRNTDTKCEKVLSIMATALKILSVTPSFNWNDTVDMYEAECFQTD